MSSTHFTPASAPPHSDAPAHIVPLSVALGDVKALSEAVMTAWHLHSHAHVQRYRVVNMDLCVNDIWSEKLTEPQRHTQMAQWLQQFHAHIAPVRLRVFKTPGTSGAELRLHWAAWQAPTPSPAAPPPTRANTGRSPKGNAMFKMPWNNTPTTKPAPASTPREPVDDLKAKTTRQPSLTALLERVAEEIVATELDHLKGVDMPHHYRIDVLTFMSTPATAKSLHTLMVTNQKNPATAVQLLNKAFEKFKHKLNTDRLKLVFVNSSAIPEDATRVMFADDGDQLTLIFKNEGEVELTQAPASPSPGLRPPQARVGTSFEGIAPSQAATPAALAAVAELYCYLLVNGKIETFALKKAFVIGRDSEGLDVDLQGIIYISSKHLTLKPTPTGWVAVDSSRFGCTLLTPSTPAPGQAAKAGPLSWNPTESFIKDKETPLPRMGAIRLGKQDQHLVLHFVQPLPTLPCPTPLAQTQPTKRARQATAFE